MESIGMSAPNDMYRQFELQAQNESLTRRVMILEDTVRFYSSGGAAIQALIHATNVLIDTIEAYDSEQRLLPSRHPAVEAAARILDKIEIINGTLEEPKA